MVGLHGMKGGSSPGIEWVEGKEKTKRRTGGNNDGGPKMIDRPAMAARVEVPLRVHRSHDMGLGMGEAFTKLSRSLGLKLHL